MLYEVITYDKLFGFELGIDDYMVKPFSPRELLARIKAIILRSRGSQEKEEEKPDQKVIEDVIIDFDARSVSIKGDLCSMTPKEYDLFFFLVRHPKKVFSREQLLNQVWGYDFIGDVRTVDTHIRITSYNVCYTKLLRAVIINRYAELTNGERKKIEGDVRDINPKTKVIFTDNAKNDKLLNLFGIENKKETLINGIKLNLKVFLGFFVITSYSIHYTKLYD